jgi:hypothetical protein
MSTGTAARNNHQYTNSKADNKQQEQEIPVLFIDTIIYLPITFI